jgi:transposase
VLITLVELAAMLEREHGERFVPGTTWRFLHRRGLTIRTDRARQRAGAARRHRPARSMVRAAA